MFVSAIEIARQFTRPIHTVERFYDSKEIYPGAASLFFVNSKGWALTCKHVANNLIASEQLAKRKNDFANDFSAMKGKKKEKQILRELEKKYQFSRKTVIEVKNRIVNCIEGPLDLEIITHTVLDVALLHFKNFTKLLCCRGSGLFPSQDQVYSPLFSVIDFKLHPAIMSTGLYFR